MFLCTIASCGIIDNYIKGRIVYKIRKDVIDITGHKFSDLTALRGFRISGRRGMFWECQCICGKICVAAGGHLRSNKRKSCGCRSENRIEETGINRLLSSYKKRAKERNLEFQLTREQFIALVKSNCSYCNNTPNQILKRQKSKKTQISYNGIDRTNPDFGYIVSNCVSACMYCNRFKANLGIEEWKNHIRKIYKWLMIDF